MAFLTQEQLFDSKERRGHIKHCSSKCEYCSFRWSKGRVCTVRNAPSSVRNRCPPPCPFYTTQSNFDATSKKFNKRTKECLNINNCKADVSFRLTKISLNLRGKYKKTGFHLSGCRMTEIKQRILVHSECKRARRGRRNSVTFGNHRRPSRHRQMTRSASTIRRIIKTITVNQTFARAHLCPQTIFIYQNYTNSRWREIFINCVAYGIDGGRWMSINVERSSVAGRRFHCDRDSTCASSRRYRLKTWTLRSRLRNLNMLHSPLFTDVAIKCFRVPTRPTHVDHYIHNIVSLYLK